MADTGAMKQFFQTTGRVGCAHRDTNDKGGHSPPYKKLHLKNDYIRPSAIRATPGFPAWRQAAKCDCSNDNFSGESISR